MSRVTKRLRPCRAGHVGMDALWVKGLTHSQQRLHLMLLVWSVLCKPKAMTGARGDAPCHIPQGPPKYRPSDKRPEEGEGPAVTEVASHAGCRLRGAQTWVAVVPRHLPPHHHPRPPRTSDTLAPEHGLSANSQHRASARKTHSTEHLRGGTHVLLDKTRKPSGWRTPLARPSLVTARL